MEILLKNAGDKEFVILDEAADITGSYKNWNKLTTVQQRELITALENDVEALNEIKNINKLQLAADSSVEQVVSKLADNANIIVRYQPAPRSIPSKDSSNENAPQDDKVAQSAPASSTSDGKPSKTPKQANEQGGQVGDEGCPPQQRCTEAGCPINMTLGQEQLPIEEFALPGPIPFTWKRFYRTGHSKDIGLGHGWTHTACEYLKLEEERVLLLDTEGREISFKRPYIGQSSQQLAENLELTFASARQFVLKKPGQPIKVFEREGGNRYRLTQIQHRAYRPAQKGMHGEWEGERGYALTLHYNVNNRLVRITGNWGRGLFFSRDDQGHITHIHQLDEHGEKLEPALSRYEYDDAGDLVAHKNADGHGEKYQYQNHIITKRTLATGFNFYFEWDQYDNNGRCLRNWGDRGIYDYKFAWDPVNKTSQTTDSRGFTTHYIYNDFGLVTEEIDNEGHKHKKEFNKAGQLVAEIDPLGNKTQYHYDKDQRLLGITNALGHQSGGSYFQGEMTTFTDAEGNRWERKFNNHGLLEEVIGPRGETTHYKYNKNGLISSVTDPAQRVTRYQWSVNAELIKETDPLGNCLHYRHDNFGRIIAVTAQEKSQDLDEADQNSTTRYEYTASGLIHKVIAADGDTSEFQYNEAGQLTKYIDPQGRITEYQYEEGLSQPSQRIDAAGNRIKYEYDKERNLIALINENGDRYEFTYDGNERLIKEVGFDSRTQHYKYNEAGHLIKHLDAGTVQTEFERDALGQLHSKSSQPLNLGNRKLREQSKYRYDTLGRLTETYNEHQYLAFVYDPLGNILKESHVDLDEHKERITASRADIKHQYNILGQRVSTQLPDGQTIQYGYHDSLAFKTVKFNNQLVTEIERDNLGRELIRHQGDLQTRTEYDPQGRLLKQQAINAKTKESPIQREYGYDQFGNVSWIKDGPEETRYIYDTLNRLKRCEGPRPEFFDFDPAGNILSISESKQHTPGLAKGNRLLIQGDKKFEYDERGNLIQENRGKDGKLQKTFYYNLQNQLVSVETNSQHETVTFKYDPLGRRIAKTDAFGTTRFLWTDNLLAQETRNNIKKTYLFEPGSFRPVALAQDDQIYHYHLDHLGTPKELTNDAGKIVWKARYKTYGNLAVKEVDEVHNNLRFQGQYFDEETGLHYNHFRYYNPETGQFINQDPIGLLGGINSYKYAPNPTQWIDPFGLCKETIPDNYDIEGDFYRGEHGFRIPDGNPDDTLTIYRGVHSKHPDFNNALEGRAVPWGGHRDVVAHNEGDNKSDFTSWSTSFQQARVFAITDGNTGVILEQQVKIKELIWSPDIYYEKEVLRLGAVSGAKVIPL